MTIGGVSLDLNVGMMSEGIGNWANHEVIIHLGVESFEKLEHGSAHGRRMALNWVNMRGLCWAG
jgi:hypothetical protein